MICTAIQDVFVPAILKKTPRQMLNPPQTFQEANLWLFSTFKPDELTFGNINYLKIVQKALHDGWMQNRAFRYGLKDFKQARIKNFLRLGFSSLRKQNQKKPEVLLFDSGRKYVSLNQEAESFYSEAWLRLFRELRVDVEIFPEKIENRLYQGDLKIEMQNMRQLCHFVENKLERSHPLIPHLQSICFNYLIDYGKAFSLLSETNPKKIILTCHYGKEGLIRAARQLGTEVIELQHGLIDSNDIFYCYPEIIKEIRSNALFPDKIFTFGDYWTNLLQSHFEFDHIITAGDYTFRTPPSGIEKRNQILITTQTGMVDDYVAVIQWAKRQVESNNSWSILLRHHPLETDENLARYRQSFAAIPYISESIGTSLTEDFLMSKIHVSIYSTTLFDAVRWPLLNYSVQSHGASAEYAKSIIKSGVAQGITLQDSLTSEQLRINNDIGNPLKIDSGYFYATFPSNDVLKELDTW